MRILAANKPMKKPIPLLALSLLLTAATPPPAPKPDTTGLYKALQEKLVLEQRIQKLEAESKERDKDEEDLKEYLHDSQGILNFWGTVLGCLIGLVGLGGVVAPYIIFKRSEKTKKEADDLLKSIQDMKAAMEEEHKKNISKGQEEVEKLSSTGKKIIRSVEALSKAGDVNSFDDNAFEEILEELNAIPESEETELEKYLKVAIKATREKDFLAAITAWKQILKQPSLGGAFLGPVFYAIGQAYLRLAESESPKDEKSLRLAEANFRASLAHQPESYLPIFFLAYTLDDLGEFSAALSIYEMIFCLPNQPINWIPTIYINRAVIKRNMGDSSGAMEDCAKAIQLSPSDADGYNIRGVLKRGMGDNSSAMQDFNKAIDLNPLYVDAYFNRAILKKDLGDPSGAMNDYNKAIELKPRSANAYYNRGILYVALNDSDAALSDFDRAIQLNPRFSWAYNNRAELKSSKGNLSEALEDSNQAIRFDSANVNAYINRAYILRALGREEEAAADEAKAAELEAAKKGESQN